MKNVLSFINTAVVCSVVFLPLGLSAIPCKTCKKNKVQTEQVDNCVGAICRIIEKR